MLGFLLLIFQKTDNAAAQQRSRLQKQWRPADDCTLIENMITNQALTSSEKARNFDERGPITTSL